MYFENREQAGQILSQTLLHKYRYEDCAVIALNSGGVIVGEQIAEYIHCVLNMLVIETLDIPGEGLSFGGISQGGRFTYNQDLSAGEISNYTVEYNGYLQEKQREAFQKINRLVGDGGTVDPILLKNRNIILYPTNVRQAKQTEAENEKGQIKKQLQRIDNRWKSIL